MVSNGLHSKIPNLTNANYAAWLPRVEDFLFVTGCRAIFKKSLSPDGVEQVGRADPDVPDMQRAAAWYAIRSSLSDECIATHKTEAGEVEELLRKIRLSYYKADTSSIDVLLTDAGELQLSAHKDVQAYVNYAVLLFSRLRDIGEPLTERLKVYYFAKGLPLPDFAVFKQLNSDKVTLDTYAASLVRFATDNPDVVGSLHARRRRADGANAAKTTAHKPKESKPLADKQVPEACKNFKKGNPCARDPCPYSHGTDTTAGSTGKGGRGRGKMVCYQCGKPGHAKAQCKSAPEGKSTEGQTRATANSIMFDDWTNTVSTRRQSASQPESKTKEISVLLDGGSTCAILNDTAGCVNVRNCYGTIHTGTGTLGVHTLADFDGQVEVDGHLVDINLPDVRIAPTFATPLISESHLVDRGGVIIKSATDAIVKIGDKTVLQAKKGSDGLYYVKLIVNAVNNYSRAYVSLANVAANYLYERDHGRRPHKRTGTDQIRQKSGKLSGYFACFKRTLNRPLKGNKPRI